MKKTENEKYNQSVERLGEWLYVNELERRKWANEKWQHPSGKGFKLSRILIPIISAYSIISVIVYCLIRSAQQAMTLLAGNVMEIQYEADIINVNLYITIMLIMCTAILAGNIILLLKKYIVGAAITAGATLVVLFHILTQINIPMPNDQYKIYFFVNIGIYLLLILLCAAIIFILVHDRNENKRMVANTLTKISRGQNETFLDLDAYADLIDAYIEDQKEKAKKR